jgi:hypothetical protein
MRGAKIEKTLGGFRLICVTALLCALCSAGYGEKYALGQTIKELRLRDGTVLEAFTVVSVSSSSVMAKWEGGRGNIKFSLLPDDMGVAFALLKRQEPTASTEGDQGDPGPEAAIEAERMQPWAPKAITGDIGPEDGRVREITGQIVVTTQGNVDCKLGAVTVYVFGLKRFYGLEAQVRAALKPTYDYFTSLHKRAMAQQRYDDAAEYSKLSVSFHDSELTLFPLGPRAVTDAEGRFVLRHTLREPYVIVARASRQVGEDVEHYEWMINSNKIGPDGKILLSNNNMRLR